MEKMNSQLITLSLMLLFLSCSKDETFRGSGNIISENRDVANFSQVYNPTSANIVITEGATQQVELSADDNVIGSIKTIVENGALKIDLAKSNYIDVTLTVSVTIPNLKVLKNLGSGNMTVSGFDGLTNLEVDNEGSGSVMLNGSGVSISIKNSGSGSYNGFGFAADNCMVANSGSGNCEINCTVALNGSNSGSGTIFYKGLPTVDISNTGSGKVMDSN